MLLLFITSAVALVELTQSSFDNGPVVTTDGETYKLMEDVVFDIHQVTEADSSQQRFKLGYFAAIIVQSKDNVIDLNTFAISASESFCHHQRFFSIIELGSTPFISGAGPFNFGTLIAAENVEIRNGRLGRSSHSSIHGNNAVGVTIVDVEMVEFEVSGFHCNGCLRISLQSIEIGPNLHHVPFNARLSQAQQLVNHCTTLSDTVRAQVVPTPAGKTLGETCDALEQEITAVLADPSSCVPETCQFANQDSLPDGSAVYGIAVVGRPGHGPIVGPFHSAVPREEGEPEFIEWVLSEEGESCSQKCTYGCAEDELSISGQALKTLAETRLGVDCSSLQSTTSLAAPAYDDGVCRYRTSGATCSSTTNSRQRICPCKSNLARYAVVENTGTAYVNADLPGKCPSGFVDITSREPCIEAGNALGYINNIPSANTFPNGFCIHSQGKYFFIKTLRFGGRICQRPTDTDHEDFTLKMKSVVVKDLKLAAQEVVHVFSNQDGTNDIKGPFAGIFDSSFSTQDGKFGDFKYNSLAALKFGMCVLTSGETMCTAELWQPLLSFFLGQETLASALGSHSIAIGCNGDGMNHRHKGIVGIRVEDIRYLKMKRVTMRDFLNVGQRTDDNGQFTCSDRFDGGDTYGLVVGGVDKILSRYTAISHMNSDHGRSVGVAYTGRVPNFDLMRTIKIKEINGADQNEETIDATNLNCPYSGEKAIRLKWKDIDSIPACPAYQNYDLCDGPISCN